MAQVQAQTVYHCPRERRQRQNKERPGAVHVLFENRRSNRSHRNRNKNIINIEIFKMLWFLNLNLITLRIIFMAKQPE